MYSKVCIIGKQLQDTIKTLSILVRSYGSYQACNQAFLEWGSKSDMLTQMKWAL